MLKRYRFVVFGVMALLTWGYLSYFNTVPAHLYKVISVENWKQSKLQDRLMLPPMDNDFIHLATKRQLEGIINKFWKNEPKFFVLTMDVKQLPGRLVLEANPGGASKYYHLYDGFIPTNSILSAQKVTQAHEATPSTTAARTPL